jgi:hypothetical protein
MNDASHMHEVHRVPYPNSPLHDIPFTVQSAPTSCPSKMFSNTQDRAISVRGLDFFRVLALGNDPYNPNGVNLRRWLGGLWPNAGIGDRTGT